MNNTVFPGILHKNRPLPALLLGLALGLTGKVHGWEGEDLFLADLPVYLTVTRLPQNITEMPAAVTIIDRAMIAASGAVEITDLFRLVPGFQVGYYHDTDGSRTIVASHGFTDQYSRRMQVLLDGFSIYKPGTGGAEWHDLPLSLDDIERIEVIRGPNAASYGANSVTGVINIITRHPSSQLATRLSSTIGERQYRQYGIRHGEKLGDLEFRVSGEYLDSSGGLDIPGEYGLNDDIQTRSLNLRADHRAGVNDYLTLQIAGGKGDREAGREQELFNPPRDKKMENNHQFLSWQRIHDTDTEVQLRLSHQRHRIDDPVRFPSPLDPSRTVINDQTLISQRYSVELNQRLRLHEKVRWIWGGELRRDKVGAESYFALGNEYHLDSRNLYFNIEWRPAAAWIVNLGNMTEHNKMVGTYQSPRLALNHLLGNHYYLRAALGRAYRMPAFLEEKGDYQFFYEDGELARSWIISEGGIQPEKQDSIEVGVGMEREAIGYDLRLFSSRTTDVVKVVDNLSETPVAERLIVNGGEIEIAGLEFQLRYAVNSRTRLHMSYAHAWADGWVIDQYDPDGVLATLYSDESDSVPEDTLSLLLDHAINSTQHVGVGFYHVSSMKRLNQAPEHTGRHISAVDLNYRRSFHLGELDGQWSVLLRDLNGAYYTVNNYLWRDRQAFFRLGIEF